MNYDWSALKVLVVEDDPLNFKYIQMMLTKRTQIQIEWAKDGLEAVEKGKADDLNLVLMDLQLPELDGLNAMIQVKAHNKKLPVIMQTANSWNDEKELCLAAGADGFFEKPLQVDLLLKHMANCMDAGYTPKKHKISA